MVQWRYHVSLYFSQTVHEVSRYGCVAKLRTPKSHHFASLSPSRSPTSHSKSLKAKSWWHISRSPGSFQLFGVTRSKGQRPWSVNNWAKNTIFWTCQIGWSWLKWLNDIFLILCVQLMLISHNDLCWSICFTYQPNCLQNPWSLRRIRGPFHVLFSSSWPTISLSGDGGFQPIDGEVGIKGYQLPEITWTCFFWTQMFGCGFPKVMPLSAAKKCECLACEKGEPHRRTLLFSTAVTWPTGPKRVAALETATWRTSLPLRAVTASQSGCAAPFLWLVGSWVFFGLGVFISWIGGFLSCQVIFPMIGLSVPWREKGWNYKHIFQLISLKPPISILLV